MKKILFLTVFLFCFFTSLTFAQTITLTSKPTSSEEKAVENFKEKVASKVEELRKKNNKAIAGFVLEIKDNLIKIKTLNKEEYQVKLDDLLTKYFKITGASQKEIDKNDIEKDDYLIVTGLLNDREITANSVFVDQPYIVETGKIIEIDRENYNIKVVASDKTIYTLSIETTTKQQIINIKTLEIERIGFSKLIVGDYVHFTAKAETGKTDNTYSVEKILVVPQEYFLK